MREPTSKKAALAWHTQALIDLSLYLPLTVVNDEPHCGWFKTRLVKDGPFQPVRIWIDQDVNGETGELQNPEVMRCQLVYVDKDPEEFWPYCCKRPISQKEYDKLLRTGDRAHERNILHPINQPYKKRSKADIPMPKF